MSLETGVISTALEAVRHQLLMFDRTADGSRPSPPEQHPRTTTELSEGMVRLIDARRTLAAALVALEAADHTFADSVDLPPSADQNGDVRSS